MARSRWIILLHLYFLICWPGMGLAMERGRLGELLSIMPPSAPAERYGNVVFEEQKLKKKMPPAIFPHWAHRARYTCRVCHTDLAFSMQKGKSGITRSNNLAGRDCGRCHNGLIAFSVKYKKPVQCYRCHVKDLKALDERFREFAKALPKSAFGNKIDWVKAVRSGAIKPRRSLDGSEREALSLPRELRKPLRLGTDVPRSVATFPHKEHNVWLDCSNCHPFLFNIKERGTEDFSMDKNLYGWFCGACHTQVAFPMEDCHRCHPGMRSGARSF